MFMFIRLPPGQPTLPGVGYTAQDWPQRASRGIGTDRGGTWPGSGSGRLSGKGQASLCPPVLNLPPTPASFLHTRPQWGAALAAPVLRFVCVSRHRDKCSYKQCSGLGANLSDAVRGCDSEYINIFT